VGAIYREDAQTKGDLYMIKLFILPIIFLSLSAVSVQGEMYSFAVFWFGLFLFSQGLFIHHDN